MTAETTDTPSPRLRKDGTAESEKPGFKLRKKTTVEVELILADGSTFGGEVFVTSEERVLDLLNGPNMFFPIRMENGEIFLVSKTSVVACKPLDTPG